MCTPTQGVWQPAGCVSCELVCVCVSLVRVVIICPASTHTALVSSPSLAVLHLSMVGILLANQDTELTQNHSGRKAASRNSWGPCGGPPCPESEAWMPIWGLSTESMKPWPPPGGGKVKQPSNGDGAGVRVFQGVTARTPTLHEPKGCTRGRHSNPGTCWAPHSV